MKRLIKFTQNGQPFYIDPDSITTVYKCISDVPVTGQTVISVGPMNYYLDEHITEVIATIEGRDSLPSKVLFGKKPK